MDFKLDIGKLTNTINEDENIIKTLEEEKEDINKTIAELTEAGWSGEAKDKFIRTLPLLTPPASLNWGDKHCYAPG